MPTQSHLTLKPFVANPIRGQKVLVVVLDGVGLTAPGTNLSQELIKQSGVLPETPFLTGNAVGAAYTPHMARLSRTPLYRGLLAHGPSVGLPSADDMGNSEVGHNAIGAGRVFAQGAKLVNEALESGRLFRGAGWLETVARPELSSGASTLHFCGLLSDGNVHSHIKHLFALVQAAKDQGVKKVRLHVLLDGRDVPPTSALEYVDALERFLGTVRSEGFDCEVASGGGRMFVTMDRYESDWRIVERGYNAHVLGEARSFASTREAIETFRTEGSFNDQDLPPFVISRNNAPVGAVHDGDSFVFLNFRGDRAIQITRALTERDFSSFPRKRFPSVHFAGMTQYDGDLKLPEVFLVEPPTIDNTMGELLARSGVRQFACSETQKYGHVTYFWNGNRSGKFNESLETYVEITSDLVPFNQRPWMKAAEIADTAIEHMRKGSFQVGRINFANGDMVGHTGDFAATVLSVAAVDLALGRLLKAAEETDTVLVVTADHGNADEMFELDKKTGRTAFDAQGHPKLKTSHSLARVPMVIYNARFLGVTLSMRTDLPQAGLANIASTVLQLAGFEPPDFYEPSLIHWQSGAGGPGSGSSPAQRTDQAHDMTNTPSPESLGLPGEKKNDALKRAGTSGGGVAQGDARTTSGAQRFEVARHAVAFFETVARLRAPGGCPWDREQTIASLRPYLIEEAYEASAAAARMASGAHHGADEFRDELGDVLLQVYLNAQIASEERAFTVADVYAGIDEKMIRRHPHVFAPESSDVASAGEVVTQWDKIKAQESLSKTTDQAASAGGSLAGGHNAAASLLKKALKKRDQPTLNFAAEVSKRSYRLGFAWKTLPETFGDVVSEIEELREELFAADPQWEKVADELGDVVYALANVITFIKENHPRAEAHFDFDLAARASVDKFVVRFQEMEKILSERGVEPTEGSVKNLDLDAWNALWVEAKKRRYK